MSTTITTRMTGACCLLLLLMIMPLFGIVDAQCITNDNSTYQVGQEISFLGIECLDETTFRGWSQVCASNQNETEILNVTRSCPSIEPFCIQCGVPIPGNALCLDTQDIAISCTDQIVLPFPFENVPLQCDRLLDGTMNTSIISTRQSQSQRFGPGDRLGIVGRQCINETSYIGSEGVCTETGTITEENNTFTCPQEAPICIQEESRSLCVQGPPIPPIQPEPQDCLLGGILLLPGDSAGVIGNECLNQTHWNGTESFCTSSGTLETVPVVNACGDSVPYCIQCGPKGEPGSAICLDTANVPSDCQNNNNNNNGTTGTGHDADPTIDGCLVGDIVFSPGDVIGQIGLECLNATHFDGNMSICGDNNGTIQDVPFVGVCPESAGVPFCVQCGERSRGAALCLSNPDVPAGCDNTGPASASMSIVSFAWYNAIALVMAVCVLAEWMHT